MGAPDCTGLPLNEAEERLLAAGYGVAVVRLEGFRALPGADGFCVVRQRETAGPPNGPSVELTACNFKREPDHES
ncbi:MAG: hypothetical protein ACOX8O_08445 [Christensenellales bacterium]|nr:hypothetical protein [Clostridiales bacterium]